MQATNFVLNDYLARIGFVGNVEPSLDVLVKLMRAQLQSVPFENLDVQARKIVSLVPEDIVNKIVYSGRGGYCYEVNGLFSMALTTIGFEFDIIGARPMFYPYRRPKSHMVLVVKMGDQRWLCDTGFGSFGLRAPLGLHQLGEIVQQDNETFRLCKNERDEFVLQALVKGEWANQFGFDFYPMEMIDFSLANYYNSTHPDAVFVQRYLVMLQRPDGRTLLSGNQLKQLRGSEELITEVEASELDAVLQQEFHLRRP
ncbi:MAG: arylamine N-acetyltransferase [Cellvibrio sp.]|uniref:arylamine N-acetyltransferase family protein n=1 Tax=Cellvibrio sp. TaxID=1965322 RepID=UPI0031A056A6